MSKDGIIALIASLAIIAGAVYWFTAYGPSAAQTDDRVEEPQLGYATEAEFPDIESASGEEVERALLEAFNGGRLLEVFRVAIPDTDGDELVLAAPTISGEDEAVDCDIRGQRFCGLYVKRKDGSKLLLWGSQLSGFAGIERFMDASHVIIASAWSMLNFTSIDRNVLDLETGEVQPKLIIELDDGEDFSELQTHGEGGDVSLWITGVYDRGRVIPDHIVLRSAENHDEIYQEFDEQTVQSFAETVAGAEDVIPPIFVLPSDEDVETLRLTIELYGEPYVLDIGAHMINHVEAEEE